MSAAGRPAILIPLPIATDDHQTANARSFSEAGAGWLIPQPEFTVAEVAKRVQKLINRPETLVEAARHARALGRPDATRLLSDLIEAMAQVNGHGSTHEAETKPNAEPSNDLTMKRGYA